jgi:hypothetical protein
MLATMSASRVPTVSERNGCYSVSIAAGTTLRWHFKLHNGRLHCFIKLDLPEGVRRYETHIDGERNEVSFPVLH